MENNERNGTWELQIYLNGVINGGYLVNGNRQIQNNDEIAIPQNPIDFEDDSFSIYIYSEFEVDEI